MNQVHLIGRLTKDIDLKKTQSGISVANFTLAINRPKQKDKEQESDFISCIAWRSTADVLKNYTSKGSKIAVNGRIQTRNYEDKDGKRVYVTEVLVGDIEFLDGKDKTTHQDSKNNYTAQPQSYDYTNNYESNYGNSYDFENQFNHSNNFDLNPDDLPF